MTNDEFIALTTEAGFEEGWVEVCKVRAVHVRLGELARLVFGHLDHEHVARIVDHVVR